ncbi:hypothetical protein RPC_2928 [Rhodopseudomonas palustris BisB18]|uniref:Uncharacterized protein n=1 Tax=Rhodopseudomonas palustris (strain BisB18) TaxID=316056 RepID=Q213G2_RHOPB
MTPPSTAHTQMALVGFPVRQIDAAMPPGEVAALAARPRPRRPAQRKTRRTGLDQSRSHARDVSQIPARHHHPDHAASDRGRHQQRTQRHLQNVQRLDHRRRLSPD